VFHLVILNFGFVLFFGIVLSLSFADVKFKTNKKQYVLIILSFGILQLLTYLAFGYDFLSRSYPFLTHLPLFLLLRHYYKKNIYIAGISVLSAYLFCTPRKWFGTTVSFFWDYDPSVSYIVQIVITIPLLLAIIKYISPYVARLKYESDKILKFFIMVPFIYYILEYILTVYTNLLYMGGAAMIEFMDASVVVVYFIFSIVYLKTLYEKKDVELKQALFKVLADQSKSELEMLRNSERQNAIYRHDLRHHINYLYALISENNKKEALSYITKVSKEIDNAKVIRYSENETVNMILSSYSAKAAEKEIKFDINVTTSDFGKFSEPDLCSLLSNALENSIHACEKIPDSNKRYIKLSMYSKNNKLCIDMRNSFNTEPTFHEGFPVSVQQGHGYGTKSMAHVVEKYGGICGFSVKDGRFVFQATA